MEYDDADLDGVDELTAEMETVERSLFNNGKTIKELSSFANPPPKVYSVMQVLFSLVNRTKKQAQWGDCKNLMKYNLARKMQSLKNEKIPPSLIAYISDEIQRRNIDADVCANVSMALYWFARWITSFVACIPKYKIKQRL
jgi:hypothetical protein